MSSAIGRSHLDPRRHPWVWFWVLTVPLVFQLTYADAESRGGVSSSEAVWQRYLQGQLIWAAVVIGVYLAVRAYRRWLDALAG